MPRIAPIISAFRVPSIPRYEEKPPIYSPLVPPKIAAQLQIQYSHELPHHVAFNITNRGLFTNNHRNFWSFSSMYRVTLKCSNGCYMFIKYMSSFSCAQFKLHICVDTNIFFIADWFDII